MHAIRIALLTALALPAGLALLAGCSGVEGPEVPEFMKGTAQGSSRQVVIPNQVQGGNPGGQALPGSSDALNQAQGMTPEQRNQRTAQAEALWARANQMSNQAAAGGIYQDLAEDYPESPHAAEAMFRYGRARFQQGENRAAIEALVSYMSSIPVNPHLGEVEEMLYTASCRLLGSARGLRKIFVTNDLPLNTLDFVAQTFPAGEYADDSLLRMAEWYQDEEEWALAVLHYKELLIRYPDSEWSFRARVGLADSYIERDQGDAYHAGFVDLDPRETYDSEQAQTFGADVRSSLRMALAQYEAFLERIELDPARQAEYAEQVTYARRMRAQVRNALAAKDLRIGRWYRSKGDRQAARTYLQYAASYGDTQSGRSAAAELRALGGGTIPAGGGMPAAPAPTPTVAMPSAPVAQPPPPRGSASRALPSSQPAAPRSGARSVGVPPPPPPPAWPPSGTR